MKIVLIAVGNKMPAWVTDGYQEYAKRLPHECRLQLIEIAPGKRGKNADVARILRDEGERMLAAIPKGARVVTLEVEGKHWDTPQLSKQLGVWLAEGQDIALANGYTPPGEDVMMREQRQVMKDWALLDAEGILPSLMEYSKWFADIVLPDEATPEERITTIHSFVTFGAASIARLKVRGLLETPKQHRLIPVLHDIEGHVINDSEIPEELIEHAVEMVEWMDRDE